jgi:hypothetical protein
MTPPFFSTWRCGEKGGEVAVRFFSQELEALTKRDPLPFAAASNFVQKNLTVLIFTSPVPSHPSSWLLERVYNSIRYHLPTARIVILADGKDDEEPKEYVEFKEGVRRLGWELVEFKGWHYHTLMLREALKVVDTPLVMINEHDWGLRKLYVDWQGIADVLLDTTINFNLIQLRQDKLGDWEIERNFFKGLESHHGVGLLPTTAFIDSMHVASSEWYRKMTPFLKKPQNLEGKDITFFINGGSPEENELGHGLQVTKGINQMACYIPHGPMGRLYHLDGANVVSPEQLDGIGD